MEQTAPPWLVDEVLPRVPLRQWVLSFPFPLRFLFAGYPKLMGQALGIVYRCIATDLIHRAGFTHRTVAGISGQCRCSALQDCQQWGQVLLIMFPAIYGACIYWLSHLRAACRPYRAFIQVKIQAMFIPLQSNMFD